MEELNVKLEPSSIDYNGKVLTFETQVIDDSIAQADHPWQVLPEDFDFFMANLPQITTTHFPTTPDTVAGRITSVYKKDYELNGRTVHSVWAHGEIAGDPVLLQKIDRKYITDTSPGVIGVSCECSGCHSASRNAEHKFVHLCQGAHEIIRKPTWLHQAIVAKGGYAGNKMQNLSFAQAMNQNQIEALDGHPCHCAGQTQEIHTIDEVKSGRICTAECGIHRLEELIGTVPQPVAPVILEASVNEPQKKEVNTQMSEKQTEVPLSKADVEGMLKTFVAQMKEQFGLQFAEVDKNFTAKMNEIQIAMKASRKPDTLPAGEGKIETPKYVNSEGMVFPMETNYLPEFLKANAANQKAHIPERSA